MQKQLVSVRNGATVNELAEDQAEDGGILGQRVAVRPVSGGTASSARASVESRFAYDFSRVPTHTIALQTRRIVQANLTVNAPGDQYEQEARRVADAVMRASEPIMLSSSDGGEVLPDDSLVSTPLVPAVSSIQTGGVDGVDITPDIQARINSMRDRGSPLPHSERTFFESRFGVDFGNVRVHTDALAVQTTRELGARAYTVGSDIAFGTDEYAPGTSKGRRLL